MKKMSLFRTIVFSRHPTHSVLRKSLPLLPFRSVVRLGSVTRLSDSLLARDKNIVECNPIEGIKNTSNKVDMKTLFISARVKTPTWYVFNLTNNNRQLERVDEVVSGGGLAGRNDKGTDALATRAFDFGDVKYPLIAKVSNHSRGRGMVKINNEREMITFFDGLSDSDKRRYSLEEFVNFAREYRIHAAVGVGVFYICRKLRRKDEEEKWYFNSKNSIFKKILINGEWLEDKFRCFEKMEKDIMKAMEALKMDIAGFDVRVNADATDYSIIEANSACSFGEFTAEQYTKMIPEILKKKKEMQKNVVLH